MYVSVKGGAAAIRRAHALLADRRRGPRDVAEIAPAQIDDQLALAVDRVMNEGSLFDRRLAALAIKQARGDLVEAAFLVRAYRTTLPRFGASRPIDTAAMAIERRISATYKDLPGGQILGPTFDYTHRLIDFGLEAGTTVDDTLEWAEPASSETFRETEVGAVPRVTELLALEGLVEDEEPGADDAPVGDLTRAPLRVPAARDVRLQQLARGDEGFLLALGYSTQRGYGSTHPFAGEIRFGAVEVEIDVPELDFPVPLGRIAVTECQMINQFAGSASVAPTFTRGYGLVFGQSERKALAMALVDRALRTEELGGEVVAPAQDQEFVLSHADNIQATGFVEHLKLPHYVDFQAELALVRQMRAEHEARAAAHAADDETAFAEAAQ